MAHWIIEDNGFGGSYYRCSECGEVFWDISRCMSDIDVCLNCKAPMNVDENEYIDDKPKIAPRKWDFKNNPLYRVNIDQYLDNIDTTPADSCTEHIVRKVCAEVVDATDELIVKAIVETAREAGVNDLFLIDKEFILSAIRHEMERREMKNGCKRDI